ncbi:MAG: TonB-dependent receptor plug domain-containing protein [Planctomycetota bacterium]|jgi:iron complex outermembrane receptor protein
MQQRLLVYPILYLAALCLFSPGHLKALEQEAVSPDLSAMELSELMDMTITSLSKKPEAVKKAAASIHVIDSDDIRRSGATTIPDLLRHVPGVQVAREDTTNWAVGIRGKHDSLTNNLLVLIDGRSVYNPIFSGADWSTLDLLFEDIERIEVKKGDSILNAVKYTVPFSCRYAVCRGVGPNGGGRRRGGDRCGSCQWG